MFDFISISVTDILDIALLTLLIYQIVKLLRGTSASSIVIGILLLYLGWLLLDSLGMKMTASIMNKVLSIGVIALVIIFQQEIRRWLLHLGTTITSKARENSFLRILSNSKAGGLKSSDIEEIVAACSEMGETRTGALIVLPHASPIQYVIDTGDTIDALINRRLIMNLFFKNSPLHDGAMVIESGRIVAARCTIPIIENPHIPPQYGLRHRAACSITSDTDADAIVVSEETGKISYVSNGILHICSGISELKFFIEESYTR